MRTCETVEALLTRYIDGEASDGGRRAVDTHLSTCPSCRARVAAQVAVRRLVRARAAGARAVGITPSWRPRALDPPRTVWQLPIRPGWALMAASVLLVVGVVWLVRPAAVSATGIIVDSACAARYQNGGRMAADEHDCTLRCVDRGAEFVFVSNAVVRPIRNQDFADLPRLAGTPVQLSGTMANDAIVVSQLAAVRP